MADGRRAADCYRPVVPATTGKTWSSVHMYRGGSDLIVAVVLFSPWRRVGAETVDHDAMTAILKALPRARANTWSARPHEGTGPTRGGEWLLSGGAG